MAKFILNRPDDYLSLSRGRIIATALKWLVILIACAGLLRIACTAVYMSMGINPMELTKFGGDPTNYAGRASWKIFVKLLLIAPLAEETMFRLGLSFKRRIVALWVGLLPIVCAWYMYKCHTWYILLGLAAVGAALYWLICRSTTDDQWVGWRQRFVIPAMWISAIGFGLMHFVAFSVLNWQVFPFALATIMIPLAGGCAITYARVNLGFWWGVLLHCIINLPPVLMIVFSMV
ncbi:MAG: CPBP family intramembrane metalloprotease [Bacteroidales bacterium]|nr:CPBP family intramembrane metalloprotease [Bacteroidales bacterium]